MVFYGKAASRAWSFYHSASGSVEMPLERRTRFRHLTSRQSWNRAIFLILICDVKRLYAEISNLTEHKET